VFSSRILTKTYPCKHMFLLSHIIWQPCFYRALLSGILSGCLCCFVRVCAGWKDPISGDEKGFNYNVLTVFPDDHVYGHIVSLVFFSTVFRCGFSIARYNEAASFLLSFTGNWFDVASSLTAFTRSSSPDNEKATKFQHLTIRMISMINALSLNELGHVPNGSGDSFYFDVINWHGIDRHTRQIIEESPCKVETAFQMLQGLVVETMREQVMKTPAPIVSRVFQEMSSGMLKFHEAVKLSRYPMPLHYRLIASVLLSIYTVVTPLEYAAWSTDPFVGPLFAFVLTFSIWFMQGVCALLEHPFTYGAGVVDLQDIHHTLNMRLLSLMHQAEQPLPYLSAEANLNLSSLTRSRASVQVKTQHQKENLQTHERPQHEATYNGLALEQVEPSPQLFCAPFPDFNKSSNHQAHVQVSKPCEEEGEEKPQTFGKAQCERAHVQTAPERSFRDQLVQPDASSKI